MSIEALPYYQRVFFRSARDLRLAEPHYDLEKHCYYMLNVCELCGQPLAAGRELPARSGRARFSIMTDTTEYNRHDPRQCDKHRCRRFIVGTWAEFEARCSRCRGRG